MNIQEKIFSYSTILTFARIILAPCVLIAVLFHEPTIALVLFITAAITDFFDGFLARKLQIQSKIGTMLDPLADKLVIGTVLIMLVKFRGVNEIPCLLILAREFIVSGLREFLALLRISLPVSNIAKIKTVLQMLALFLLLLGSKGSTLAFLDVLGEVILWLTALFTLITGYSYLIAAIKYTINDKKK